MKKFFTKFLQVLLISSSLLAILPSQKAKAELWEECATGMCIIKAVYDGTTWQPDSISAEPGEAVWFNVGIWNQTGNASGAINVKDTLPTYLTYVDNTLKLLDKNGEHVVANDNDLFAVSGLNLSSLEAEESYQLMFKVNIDENIPASDNLTNTASMTSTIGNGTDEARINVSVAELPADSGLTGYYYNNKDLFGDPSATRIDPVLDTTNAALSWPLLGSPAGLNDDNFSVKWQGQMRTTCTGPITLKTNSDDGIRVFLNDVLIIDKWFDRGQPTPLDSAVVNLTAGNWNNLRVDYFEHAGGSIAQLFWNSACQTGGADQIIPQVNLRQTYTGVMNYGLQGRYYNNTQVNGSPVLTRTDLGVNYVYDLNSPAPGVNADHFSIKWTGKITTNFAETYQFCVTSDDGARLWIDDVSVMDQYTPHGMTEYCGNIALSAGQHNIRLDYFDSFIDAAVNLKWSSPSQTGGVKQFIPLDKLSPNGFSGGTFGLTGDYFNNMNFNGTPVFTRVDGPIDFDFGQGSPSGAIDPNTFSIEWNGKLNLPETGDYNFIIYSDDGVRLRLDDVVRINQLVNQSNTRTETGPLTLNAGEHTIRIRYFDYQEGAGIKFMYTTPSDPTERLVPMSVLLAN